MNLLRLWLLRRRARKWALDVAYYERMRRLANARLDYCALQLRSARADLACAE